MTERLGPLEKQHRALKRRLTAQRQWVAKHVKHPEWEQGIRDMSLLQQRLHMLEYRMENIRNGLPEYGHEIPPYLNTNENGNT